MGEPVEAVSFDAEGYVLTRNEPALRVWTTPAGDGLGLFFFQQPPDLPPDALRSIPALVACYRGAEGQAPLGVVEVDHRSIDGFRVVRTVLKVAQGYSIWIRDHVLIGLRAGAQWHAAVISGGDDSPSFAGLYPTVDILTGYAF